MLAPMRNASPEQLAAAANAALRGETLTIGLADIPAGALSVTLYDPRFGSGRYLVFLPLNASAASTPWHLQSMSKGEAAVAFPIAPETTASFAYAILGVGTPQGAYHGPVTQNG